MVTIVISGHTEQQIHQGRYEISWIEIDMFMFVYSHIKLKYSRAPLIQNNWDQTSFGIPKSQIKRIIPKYR